MTYTDLVLDSPSSGFDLNSQALQANFAGPEAHAAVPVGGLGGASLNAASQAPFNAHQLVMSAQGLA